LLMVPIILGLEPNEKAPDLEVRGHGLKHEREELNPVGQFWRLLALPGAHSWESGVRGQKSGVGVPQMARLRSRRAN
jgi:hypothetical protein